MRAAPERFNPAYALRDETAPRRPRTGDAVLHLWSSLALAACSAVDRPVYAYYGNPDDKALEARLSTRALRHPRMTSARNRARLRLWRLSNRNRRRVNVRLMRTARWAANVCAVDAEFFAAAGHPDAFYVQNMWPDLRAAGRRLVLNPARSSATSGGLYATGNTFGLWHLARRSFPASSGAASTTASICTAPVSIPSLARSLERPECAVAASSTTSTRSSVGQLFLILNNCKPDFIVCHTRVLHAWSLGLSSSPIGTWRCDAGDPPR